jgi:hypothetical protein
LNFFDAFVLGDGSSSEAVGHLLSSSSVDAASGACIDSEAAAAAMNLTGESLSPTTSFAVADSTQSSILAPLQSVQKPRAAASSDSDNTPVSPVRNSSARSTPIAIGVPRYFLSALSAFQSMVQ